MAFGTRLGASPACRDARCCTMAGTARQLCRPAELHRVAPLRTPFAACLHVRPLLSSSQLLPDAV